MENTDKTICRMIAEVLVSHGISTVFSSPGSRNTPLIVAFNRHPELKMIPVADERVAAFMALGYSSVSGEPVVLVCTSGTAILNYSPAIAEAYYRRIPLIVISADRPLEWIDQDDSQTIRQFGILANFVKNSYDISESKEESSLWYANRIVNDAILLALSGRKAPVHINVRLVEPLGSLTSNFSDKPERIINVIEPREDIAVSLARRLASELASPRKIMIVAGFMPPDSRLNSALNKIARLPNIIILSESISNIHGEAFIDRIDTVLSNMTSDDLELMKPDVVITLGGALVSRLIKTYLRKVNPLEHWHVGILHTTVDCFCSLTKRIELEPGIFFQQLASGLQPYKSASDYSQKWHEIYANAAESHDKYVESVPWSDMKAFHILFSSMPRRLNIQLSNGTPIRYAQLFADNSFHRVDCNRGVSGIDGATSTAIGAALSSPGITTLLITGDMGAQYDVGALAYLHYSPRLRVIVISNGGGGIFRFIPSTCNLPELNKYFSMDSEMPMKALADAYGIRYFEASDEEELKEVLPDFINPSSLHPAVLTIKTQAEISAKVLKKYFLETNIIHKIK